MHAAREMYDDVTDIKIGEVPDWFFHMTFIRRLTLCTGEARRENELVHALHKNMPPLELQRYSIQG